MTAELDVDPETGLVRRPPPSPYPFGPATMASVLDGPRANTPDRLALVDEHRTWTFRELDVATAHAAAALHGRGVRPGDRVAWSMPNRAELPIGFLATQRLGAVWVGVNPTLAPPERQFLVEDSETSVFISDAEAWGQECAAADPGTAPSPAVDPHAPAAIAYTSGTTGRPKGVVHSQHNLLWPGLVSVETDPPSHGDRQGTPLAHTILNMIVLGVVSAWVRGTTGVVLRRGRADELAADVARHRITRITLVPAQIHDLVHSDDVDPADLATLRSVIVGGAATPAPLRRAFLDRFGIRAIGGYGLSEAPSGVARESPDDPIDEPARAVPMAPFEVTIRGGDGATRGPGQEGEVCIGATREGPWAGCWTPMLGYWRRPEETRGALEGGVLHTDDLGTIDERGRLTVTGRRDELILRGGANVSPAEVEEVLCGHPHVAEASVVGVHDTRLGQRVVAVITSGVAEPDTAGIRDHCARRLARYKVPDAVAVVDVMPRNAMGKIPRTRLVEIAAVALADTEGNGGT